VRANREYELIVTREGRAPSVLADPERVDRIEVVEIASGEVVLFWDLHPRHTRRMARALRGDLAQLAGGEFLAKWRRYEG